MAVSTRARNRNREVRNCRSSNSTTREKTTRDAVLMLIGKVINLRLQKESRLYGVIRRTFTEYHQRYDWLTERQVRYAYTKYKKNLEVSSAGTSFLVTNADHPERTTVISMD